MRVLLVANYIPDSQQSMLRFAGMLSTELAAAGHEVRVARPAPLVRRVAIGNVAAKWLGHIDKYLLFPPTLRRLAGWADIVHICDHSNSIYLKHLRDKPNLITCHDLFGIRGGMGDTPAKVGFLARQLQKNIDQGLREASNIACVSDATRNELLRLTGIDQSRVSRVYNGLNYPYTPMPLSETRSHLKKLAALDQMPFILHVGGNQWYKNRLGLLKLFSHMRQNSETRQLNLITVGKPWTSEMLQFAEQARLGKSVLALTNISEQELCALYSTAELLLFPSLEEGFGWPVAEAQACGCPVVTTNRAPMTEVGGEAAIYMNPQDPASVISAVIKTREHRNTLRDQGLRNASRFCASQMVKQYEVAYKSASLKSNSPRLRPLPVLLRTPSGWHTAFRAAMKKSFHRDQIG